MAAPFSKLDSEPQRRWGQNRHFFHGYHGKKGHRCSPSCPISLPRSAQTLLRKERAFAQDKSSELKAGNCNNIFVNISINLTPRSHANVMQACIHLVFPRRGHQQGSGGKFSGLQKHMLVDGVIQLGENCGLGQPANRGTCLWVLTGQGTPQPW